MYPIYSINVPYIINIFGHILVIYGTYMFSISWETQTTFPSLADFFGQFAWWWIDNVELFATYEEVTQPKIPVRYDRIRQQFPIGKWNPNRKCPIGFPIRVHFRSGLSIVFPMGNPIGSYFRYQLSDRILFPIGFVVGFSSTSRSDPIVVFIKISDGNSYRNFWLGESLLGIFSHVFPRKILWRARSIETL